MRSAVAIGLFLGQLIHATPAAAADVGYCEAYAKDLARILIPMVIRRAEGTCLNAELEPGPPLPKDWIAALRIVDPAQPTDLSKIGVVPATDETPPQTLPAPLLKREGTIAPKTKVSSPSPAETCAHVHRRVVWTGKRWNCR